MAASRSLGFGLTENSAVRSTDSENPIQMLRCEDIEVGDWSSVGSQYIY